MDNFEAVVIGAAAAAIGTIIAQKLMNPKSVGGGEPHQIDTPSFGSTGGRLRVVDIRPLTDASAPVAQINPITESAYNIEHHQYQPAFGHSENNAENEEVLTL